MSPPVVYLWSYGSWKLKIVDYGRVRSVTQKLFKVPSWNFMQILTNIRRRAERKNYNSCIYTFWVMPLWTLLVAFSKTKSHPLCNFKAVQGIFMKLHTNINQH